MNPILKVKRGIFMKECFLNVRRVQVPPIVDPPQRSGSLSLSWSLLLRYREKYHG